LSFRPARSNGSAWLIGTAAGVVAIPVLLAALTPSPTVLIVFAVCGLIAVWLLALAVWFPSMRYEISEKGLTIVYGPILRWQIPLRSIRGTRWTDLKISLLASHRLPGFALFAVKYRGLGTVRMCASRAARHVLLIDTDHGPYGITPADEEGFVAALRKRTGR
jgi:hypothetical protein